MNSPNIAPNPSATNPPPETSTSTTPRKRSSSSTHKYTDVSDTPENKYYSTNIQGVVTAISDKMLRTTLNKKHYYTGKIFDDKKTQRIVGFSDTPPQKILHQFQGKPVAISNCKCARSLGMIEISDKQFNIPKEVFITEVKQRLKKIQLAYLLSHPLSDGNRYNVAAAVTLLDDISNLNDGRRLQKAHLVDQSGSATITLWGEWIDVVQHGKSYIFQHVHVREWDGER